MPTPRKKVVATQYDQAENILHLWMTEPVTLADETSVAGFFDEVIRDHIDKTPTPKFWLLVNYQNLRISPKVLELYAQHIARFQSRLLGTYRYNIDAASFTRVAVSLGNFKLQGQPHMFDSEQAARHAIREAKQRGSGG